MNKMWLVLLFAIISIQAPAETFSISKYLQKCGGKIYSKCDGADVSQETIFDEARELANKNHQQIMIVIGADWCPSCVLFAKMVANDPNASKLHSKFVVVELNGELKSTKALARKLNFSFVAFPQAFIIKPKANEVIQQFFPSSYNSVDSLLAIIGVSSSPTLRNKPKEVGNVLVSSLEKSIKLSNDYGNSTFVAKPKTQAEKFINQGVAALQVYHYLDSFRSFREAQKNDPENVMSYVGQILAILQMDRYGDGLYFADEAIEKIKSISKRKPLTKTESAYFEFAKSLKMSSSMNYVKTPGIEIKSLQDAYVDVLRADGENTDGISLITWFAMPSLDDKYVREIYDTVLKRQPKNIGAHHALLHLSEMNSDEVNSTIHATALAALAPKSAHAQHMYGHTLPQKGKWSEALTYFKKANSIHISWAAKNDLDLNQDWHYSHNLDLMAAAYLGSGNLNKALETWKMATQDSRAIHHYIALLVVLGESNEANRWLTSLEKSGWEKYLKPLRVELELTTENKDSLSFAKDSGEESEYNKILKKIAQNYPNPSRDAQLSESISNYFSKKFKAGGFDGWSNAYIEMLRMKRVARIFKANWIIDDIQPLEYAIQNGSLCGSATKATSLTKCMQ